MNKRYRIISKFRFYSFLVTILAIFLISLILFFSRDKVHSSSYDESFYEVEISQGDTLWNIALKYLPEKTDVRSLVYDIGKVNDMQSYYIYPGDVIKIPIY